MTKDEALKLALEALVLNNAEWKHLADSGDSGDWSAEDQDHYKQTEEAITAIKEALAQPEQEPVVWMYQNKSTHEVRFQKYMRSFVDHSAWYEIPLYSEPLANQEKTSGSPIKEALTQPQPWEKFCDSNCVWTDHHPDCKLAERLPLTDEKIGDLLNPFPKHASEWGYGDFYQFARAIEAAHGIGE